MQFEDILKEVNITYALYKEHNLEDKMYEFIKKDLRDKLEIVLEKNKQRHKMEYDSDSYINEFLINSPTKYMYIPKTEVFIENLYIWVKCKKM